MSPHAPAQIPAGGISAPGSHLGCLTRRSVQLGHGCGPSLLAHRVKRPVAGSRDPARGTRFPGSVSGACLARSRSPWPPPFAPPTPPQLPAFVRRLHSCRVGGGALDWSRADLRPPHKLDVQFSRIQLSRRRYPLSGDGRDQRDKINKPELAVELAEWQRCPATAAPLAEPMRPNSPHQPAIELVEELSDVSPL